MIELSLSPSFSMKAAPPEPIVCLILRPSQPSAKLLSGPLTDIMPLPMLAELCVCGHVDPAIDCVVQQYGDNSFYVIMESRND